MVKSYPAAHPPAMVPPRSEHSVDVKHVPFRLRDLEAIIF